MKANKTTILLLGSLFIVWGIIGYMLYRYFFKADVITYANGKPAIYTPNTIDTFSLLLNYPNPFPGNSVLKSNTINSPTPSAYSTKPSIKNQKKFDQPEKSKIKYLGLLKGRSSRETSLIVKVNKEEMVLNVGDQVEDFIVISANEENLVLKKGIKKTVLKREE